MSSSSTRRSPRHLDRSDSTLTSPTLDDTYGCDPDTDRDLNPLHSSVLKGGLISASVSVSVVTPSLVAKVAAVKQSKNFGVVGGTGPGTGSHGISNIDNNISNSNNTGQSQSQSRRGSIENYAKPPVSSKVSSATAAASSAGVPSVYNTTTSSSRAKRSDSIDPFTALLLMGKDNAGAGGGGGGNDGGGFSNPMHSHTTDTARSVVKDHETDRQKEKEKEREKDREVVRGKDIGNEREKVRERSTDKQPRTVNGGARRGDPNDGAGTGRIGGSPRIVKGGHKESKEYLKMTHTEAPRLSDLEAMKQAEIDDCVEWVKRASELMHTQQLPSPPSRTSQSSSSLPLPAPLSVSDSTTSTSSPLLSLTLSITPRGNPNLPFKDHQQQTQTQSAAPMRSSSNDHMREMDAAACYMKSQIAARQMIETNDDSYENLARSFSLDSSKGKGDKKEGGISRDKVKGPSATIILGASGALNVAAAKKEKERGVQSRGAAVREEKAQISHVEVEVDADPSRMGHLEAIIAYFREQAEAKPGEPTTHTPFPFTFPATATSSTTPPSVPLSSPVSSSLAAPRVDDIRQMSPIFASQVSQSALLSSDSASAPVPTHISNALPHFSVTHSSIHHTDTSPSQVSESIRIPPPSSSSRPPSATRVTPHDPIPLTSVIPPPRHPSPVPTYAKSHKVLRPSELPFPKSPKSLSRSPLPRTTIASLILQASSATRPAVRSRNSNSTSPPLKSLNGSSPPSRSPAMMTKAGRSSTDTGTDSESDRDSVKAIPVPTKLFSEKPHIESFFKTDRSLPTDDVTKRGEERGVAEDKAMHSGNDRDSEIDKEMEIAMNESQLISLLSSYDSLPISQLASVVREIMSESTQTRSRPTSIPNTHLTEDLSFKSSSKVSQRVSDPTRSPDYIFPRPKEQGPSHPPVPAPAPVPVLVRAKTPDKERKSRLSINTAVTRGPELVGPGSGSHVAATAKASQVSNTQSRPSVSSTNANVQRAQPVQIQNPNLHKAWKSDSRTTRETKVVQKRVKEINEECKRARPIISKKADIWDGKISSSDILMERPIPKQPMEKRAYLKRKSAVSLIIAVKSPPKLLNPNPNASPNGSPNPLPISNPVPVPAVGPKSPLLERRAFKGGDIEPYVKSPEVSGDVVIIGSADSSLFRPQWNDDTHVELPQQPFPPVLVVSRSPPRARGEGEGGGVRASGITPPKQWGVKDNSRDKDSEKGKDREGGGEREREKNQSIDIVTATYADVSAGASMSMRSVDNCSADTIPTKLNHTQVQVQAPTQKITCHKAALEGKLKKKMEELDLVVRTWNDSMASGDCGTVSVDHFDALSITDSMCSTLCDSTLRSGLDTPNASAAVGRKPVRDVESRLDVADSKALSPASESDRDEVEASSGEIKKSKSEVVVVEKDVRFMSMREKLELKLKMCEDELH